MSRHRFQSDYQQVDRTSTFRSNFKKVSESAVVNHFGLKMGCADDVDFLTQKMQYIFPYDIAVRFSCDFLCR
jgi:hypothetical protein